MNRCIPYERKERDRARRLAPPPRPRGRFGITRRSLLTGLSFAVTENILRLPNWGAIAQAEERVWRHGLSPFGDLKYPTAFKHFDYVNPNAPKDGVAWQGAFGTFDNFNTVIAGLKGSLAAGVDLIYETLLVASLDEISSEYGLLATAVSYPEDFSSASYRLRPEAQWHDGTPVTPEDVIFSFEAFKKYSPQFSAQYLHVTKAEKTNAREITFIFDRPGNRELPQVVGRLTVLPKHWWEGADKDGRKRDIGATTLEPPLGSGPYRLKDFSAGRKVIYERVKDHWGKDLNCNVGLNNFDELHYEYFRDTTAAFEAFKTNTVDWRTENNAKNWATAYGFPAVSDKRVVLEEFPIRDVGMMQAFAFNTRREKFQDARVRLAFNYAFNFEEMNKEIFFSQYQRITSYFEGTNLAATGLPNGKELELLETVRDAVPPELFTQPYSNPANNSREEVRTNLREAIRLFKEAGYEVRDLRLINTKTNEPYAVELLAADPSFERVFLFFKPSLERLGINVTVRTVDQAQYENRLRMWDFDIITAAWAQTLTPGNEQRGYWGSRAADEPGSLNLIGIKNPAVDNMIEHVVEAKNRADLEAAVKALDRILLWNHYVVPQWAYGKVRTARWDRFGHPDLMPTYGRAAFPTVWWWDASKAAEGA
jgi:microcin C transport system substrate-binding protein